MKTNVLWALRAGAIILLSEAVWADEIYVNSLTGSDSSGTGSSSAPYKTLEFAYAKVADNGTIVLKDGTYPIDGTELDVDRPVTIRSENGPANCIVKCSHEKDTANPRAWGVFHVTHADAKLEGLSITSGNRYNTTQGGGASAVYMTAGLVTNCWIHNNGGGQGGAGNAGAVKLTGGRMTDCLIYANEARYNNTGCGVGGGVYLEGGTVDHCVISNNVGGSSGAGAYVSGTGLLCDSLIVANHRSGGATAMTTKGGGAYIAGGTVERCVIRGNYGATAGGVYLTGGKLLNSLVVANVATYAGAGVFNEGGTVVNCTVAANEASDVSSGNGFSQTKGTTQNTVVYGNPCGAGGDVSVTGGTFDHNFTMVALSGYADNQHGNVFYRDADGGDYRLLAGSKAIDGAVAYDGVAVDLDGVGRPEGGAPDMGCYECVSGKGALTVTFNAPETATFLRTGSATFTATVDGTNLTGVAYDWSFDGVAQSETGRTVSWSDIGLGKHTVRVVASNDCGETAVCEQVGVIRVTTDHVYANVNGSDTYPYDKPEKGAHALQDALDAVWVPTAGVATVSVKPGDYYPDSKWFQIGKAIHLESTDGPAVTKLVARNQNAASYDGGHVRRVLCVNHADAVVSGFTVSNGWWYSSAGDSGPGGMRLEAGVVTNCVFTRNRGGDKGGAVQMSGGTLVGCSIHDNYARYNNDGCNTRGGGVYLTGGTVRDCEIYRNWAATPTDTGSGVWASGGVVTNCVIHSNFSKAKSMRGIGLCVSESARVECCVISNNSKSVTMAYPSGTSTIVDDGGGVYLTGGTVRNCLIVDNRSNNSASGVYQTGGLLEYCTIADNVSVNKINSGLYLNGSKAVCRYNVIWDNGTDTGDSRNISYVAAACFATNVVTPATSGTDNLGASHSFYDPENGDWTPAAGSQAIDAGPADDGVTVDLRGTARPKDGSGKGEARNDLGCYEYERGRGPLTCSFAAPETAKFYKEGDATFTASVDGSDQKGVGYTWYFDGVEQSGTEASIDWSKIGLGTHTVKLVVTNAAGEKATSEIADVVRVSTDHVYANADGTDTYPYDTPEKGAHSLQDALDAVMDPPTGRAVVTVKPGRYSPEAKWFVLERAIVLESSDGPKATHLYGNNPDGDLYESRRVGRVLYMNHADAVVSGFTVSNGWWYAAAGDSGPGGMRLAAGVVTNCVFTHNRGGNCGGAIQMSGGMLVDCAIHDNYARYNNDGCDTRGGGVYMTGGVIDRCRIYRNWAAIPGDTGSGVWMSGGAISNSVIHSNFSRSTGMLGIGLCMSGSSLVECCVISNNVKKAAMTYPSGTSSLTDNAGGVYLAGGVLRNSLVVDNDCSASGGGVYQTGGTMEYCTVSANTSANKVNSGVYLNGATATNRCNVIWGNGAGTDVEAACNISYVAAACFATNVVKPSTSGTDNIGADHAFNDAANGDWTLATGSSAIDAGPSDDGVTADLAGNERPKDGTGLGYGRNDLGCYEASDVSEGPLACSFSPASTVCVGATDITFTASVSGRGSTEGVEYAWDFGAGEVIAGGGTATPTVRFSSLGAYAVSLTVRSLEGDSVTREVADCVRVGSARVFVREANENCVWPYATWETAATNLEEALESLALVDGVVPTVMVSNGTYRIAATALRISYPVSLVSVEGPERTTLRAAAPASDARRCMDVTHEGAFVSGFTLGGASWDSWGTTDTGGAALRISAGVVSNCVVTGAVGTRTGCGAVTVRGTGVLTHSVIRNSNGNHGGSSGTSQFGGGLELSGSGVADHLVISNCYVNKGNQGSGGGVAVYGGTLRDSRILDCYLVNDSLHGSAVYQTDGLIDRCVIGDSRNRNTHGAAIYQAGGTIRNSLVFGARAKTEAQALYMTGGSFFNNTVVSNGYDSANSSPTAAVVVEGDVVNCIFSLNENRNFTISTGSLAGTYTEDDPGFRNPSRGNWRLRHDSPCINTGVKLDWMTDDTTDLVGNPRVRGRVPDPGCYENPLRALTVIVR